MSHYDGQLRDNAVAIISMACRFPLGDDVDTYWRKLCQGVEAVRPFSEGELRAAGVGPEMLGDAAFVNSGSVIEGFEQFDAGFFGFTPKEAEILDPQQRLLLECSYHVLEQAGYAGRGTKDVGVFVGTAQSSYLIENLFARADLVSAVGPMAIMIANDKDFAATQLAYRLDLKGPAVNINTACSTSLVAVHQAVSALLDYQCDLAIAGGATVRAQQKHGYRYVEGGIASPDGHCRPFSSDARGTVDGNGAGVVLLKRLADALADNDSIEAVIVGSAVNNDGADKVGITAPSVKGQARVIHEALARAGIRSSEVGYVECHGTATPLGDPIEVAALKEVFASAGGFEPRSCALGSVKSNMGHLDAAAGIAGLIKAVLCVKHGSVAPSINFKEENPELGLAASPFYVANALHEWPAGHRRRFAGVSSFGIGGTNAHVVLAAPPVRARAEPADRKCLLTLSAKTALALEGALARLVGKLEECVRAPADEARLADIGRTLARRPAHPLRCAIVARDFAEALQRAKETRVRSSSEDARFSAEQGRHVLWELVCPAAVDWSIARSLHEDEPAFRAAFEACLDCLEPEQRRTLRSFLIGEQHAATQPSAVEMAAARFAWTYACAALYAAAGAPLHAVAGSGASELVAAQLCGIVELRDALRLACKAAEVAAGAARRSELEEALRATRLRKPSRALRLGASSGPCADEQACDACFWLERLQCAGVGETRADSVLRFAVTSTSANETARVVRIDARHGGSSHWLEALGELWLAGADVDVAQLYAAERGGTVSLPGYAFDRRTHWIAPQRPEPRPPHEAPEPAGSAGARLGYYAWRVAPLVLDRQTGRPKRRLVIADDGGFAATVFGTGDCAMSTIEGCRELIAGARGAEIDAIECFHGLTDDRGGSTPARNAATLLQLQSAVLALVRAVVARSGPAAPLPLLRFYLRGAFQVTGADDVDPVSRALAAMLTVVNQELPAGRVQVIDLDDESGSSAVLNLVRQLERHSDNHEVVHALRRNRYWTRRFEAAEQRTTPTSRPSRSELLVYTGGLGKTGSQAAKYLALQTRRLVIVGRRPKAALTADARSRLDGLLAINRNVEYVSADVSSAAFVEVLRTIADQHGPITTLIHAAADMQPRSLKVHSACERHDLEQQHAAKVTGTLNVLQAAATVRVDNIVLMSSLAASLGGLGLGAYAAANAFMDALAERSRDVSARSMPRVFSIAWDGLGSPDATDSSGSEWPLIGAAEMIGTIWQLVEHHEPGLWLYAHGDVNRRWERSVRKFTAPAARGTRSEAARPVSAADVNDALARIYEQVIGSAPTPTWQNFFEMGGDSLSATQLCMMIRQEFSVDLPLEIVFDAPELERLAAHVQRLVEQRASNDREVDKLLDEIEQMDEEKLDVLLS